MSAWLFCVTGWFWIVDSVVKGELRGSDVDRARKGKWKMRGGHVVKKTKRQSGVVYNERGEWKRMKGVPGMGRDEGGERGNWTALTWCIVTGQWPVSISSPPPPPLPLSLSFCPLPPFFRLWETRFWKLCWFVWLKCFKKKVVHFKEEAESKQVGKKKTTKKPNYSRLFVDCGITKSRTAPSSYNLISSFEYLYFSQILRCKKWARPVTGFEGKKLLDNFFFLLENDPKKLHDKASSQSIIYELKADWRSLNVQLIRGRGRVALKWRTWSLGSSEGHQQ